MTHGTASMYNHGGCRCQPCTKANRHAPVGRRWYQDLTAEQRRHCLICGVALSVHPMKACWREVR